jgi:hypothetical protein
MRASSLLAAGALALTLAGCGDSDKSSGPATGTTTTTATTSSNGIDPLTGAGTTPVSGPAMGEDTALLERIAVARHEGYDRVVFQFRNHRPGYRIEYQSPPFAEDGSGNPVEVAGNAFVVVRMEPASGFDLSTGEGELVYKGPRRIEGADVGTSVVRELVRLGDFEAVLTWVIGLEEKVEFRVLELDHPARLVVDFRNH